VAEVDFAKFGAVEVKPLGRIQKISGPRLQASWLNVPHVWQMDEADITELEETRNKLKADRSKAGVKLTPLAFILRACVKALREFPMVNSSLDASGQNLVFKKYVHLGFAADTPNGLVVPVIRDADKKDVYELARELATLSEKARAGKLSALEMQGASFTVYESRRHRRDVVSRRSSMRRKLRSSASRARACGRSIRTDSSCRV
jgi:pyruvate dehydrogenase E2 component (dihydrolipoamide acetyltransferase)